MKKMLIGIAAVSLLSSCTQVGGWFGSDADSTQNDLRSENAYRARMVRDLSITKENGYSDLFLDSAALENYIRQQNISDENASRMREFYLVRNNQYAWFSSNGLTEPARGLWSLRAGAMENAQDTVAKKIAKTMDSLVAHTSIPSKADTSTLVTSETLLKDSAALMDGSTAMVFDNSDAALVQTELALTHQLVQLAGEQKGVITLDNFYWLVPRKRMDALQLADSLLNEPSDSAAWAANTNYTALKKQLQLYCNAVKNGGWNSIPLAQGLKKGTTSPAVISLRKRLAATGDYPAGDTSTIYNDTLFTAVKNIQQQFGFQPTGLITDSLVRELNVPAEERLQQILVNMNRSLWMPQQPDSNHIIVNIPSLQLVVYSDSGNVMEMPVIVGKEGTATLAFSDKISKIVFNPYWNIPQSIVQSEIQPAMKNDPAYLKKHNMEIVRQDNNVLELRQLPGHNNALGRVKFLFPNSFDIYLHDTPQKDLFARQNRALSHGCIRVAKPDSLAHFLLQGQADWTPEKIAAAMNSGKEQTVEVKAPVAVSIRYATAFVDEKGRMNFRKDVYGFDKKTTARMFTNTKRPAICRLTNKPITLKKQVG